MCVLPPDFYRAPVRSVAGAVGTRAVRDPTPFGARFGISRRSARRVVRNLAPFGILRRSEFCVLKLRRSEFCALELRRSEYCALKLRRLEFCALRLRRLEFCALKLRRLAFRDRTTCGLDVVLASG